MDDLLSNNDSAISTGSSLSSSGGQFSELSSNTTSINLLPVKKRERRQSSKGSNSSNSIITKLTKIKTRISIDRRSSINSTKTNLKTSTKRIRKIKKERKQYLCNVCEKQFLGSSDLRKHLLIHSDERPFECETCHKKFRQAISLKNHIASIHGTNVKFTCEHCSRSFPIKERLRLHMRIHSGEKPYSCKQCTKTFARGGQLRQHLITHQNQFNIKKIVCSICSSLFSNTSSLRTHMKTHEDHEYVCKICERKFSQSGELDEHLTVSHAKMNKKFHCDICNKNLKGHINQHMKIHENIRPFNCEVCGAQFSQKSQLNVHVRMHSGERPYRCEVCWQAFAYSSVLKLHIRKHTGEKPFKCNQSECVENDIAFSQLAHLKTHMRTIHNLEKTYQCDGCKNFFKIKLELQTHQEKCIQHREYIDNPNGLNNSNNEETLNKLSKLRLLITILLTKISTPERLKELGFEKRLIDNVIITALRLANRKYFEDENLNEFDRLKLNIEQFLEWTIPSKCMAPFKEKQLTIETILDELLNAYKQTKI